MGVNFFYILIFLTCSLSIAQADYNSCNSPGELCPQVFLPVSNIGANVTFCPSCEDDFTNCFTPYNTVWLTFQTNDNGGNAFISGNNVTYNAGVNNNNNSFSLMVLETTIPCSASAYTEIDCLAEQQGAFTLEIEDLEPNKIYYIVISGTRVGPGALDPSEFTMDLRVSGEAVNRPPAQIILGSTTPVTCTNLPVEMIVNMDFCPGEYEINWYRNDEFWFTSASNVIVVEDLEDNDIIRAETSCFEECPVDVVSNSIFFTVLDFFVNAGPDREILKGESVQLAGSTSGVNYYWEPELWLSDPTVLDPIAFPEQTTTFFLTATNGECELTDEMTIIVRNDLVIPSIFSPNGDGINDTWEILGAERYPNMLIEVYDRWGQKVFESISYNEDKFWDGTYRGKLLRTSTYYYVINLNDPTADETILKGPVSIVR